MSKGIWAGTFHSFGLTLLRRFWKEANLTSEFGVLDSGDASSIVKELLRDFNYAGKSAYDGEKLVSLISTFREAGRTEAKNDDEYEVAVEWLLPRYLKRLEMLGTSFIPQHSDARVLEQLIYKWRNTRRTLAPILTNTYQTLAEDGRAVSRDDIRRDVAQLFRGNFERCTQSD